MSRRKPSIAAAHADWLRLVETSGPFLSLPVLVEHFSHGLDAIATDRKQRLRDAYEEWTIASAGSDSDRLWIRLLIEDLLEHDSSCVTSFDEWKAVPSDLRHHVAEHSERLWPQLVIHEPTNANTKSARCLICRFPRDQRLDKGVANSRWAASPQSRMAELCRATGVRLGLVTNGEQWTLVDAPSEETVGYATWYAQLWIDEPDTFAAFHALLGRHRLFAVGEDETLESLLTKSRENQHEVTDQLGLQVRRAVEMLIRALDRADQDLGGKLLHELTVEEIYEAAVTFMMRLVFLFSAEERGLLLLGDPLFDQYYAVSTLCDQLREVADQHGEEILERRRDAWCRLLAAFRAVHGGVNHDRLQIPAYGGGLFDPDRFPFLEGRRKGTTWSDSAADPLPVDNRTVLHCLESLQYLQTKIGRHVESRRLSFRELGIEQIGHVYEGLLDHTAVRAEGPTLGLLGREGAEPEVPLEQLEDLGSRSQDDLVDYLATLKVRSSKNTVRKLLDSAVDADRAERIRRACRSDALWDRVKPFASVLRDDDFGQPIVILEGQLYATAGLDRRSTGTHYTPPSLTEPIVEHTLEPLVYEGPAEGKEREEWKLKSSKEILDLKVCDMACGSGAFLVQTCRYLGDRLVEAWLESEGALDPDGTQFINYEGVPATDDRNLVPRDPDERKLVARRLVAERCLFGVDVNPLACEMAKLSLWLLTLAKDKPFSFVDHAIKCGDSLLGLYDLEQLKRFNLNPAGETQYLFSGLPLIELIESAAGTRIQIENITSNNIGHVQTQARLLQEAEQQTQRLRYAADLLISAYLAPAARTGEQLQALDSAAVKAAQLSLAEPLEHFRTSAERALNGRRPLHWCLEFPEVFAGGGFHAVVCNPPFAAAPLRSQTQPWLENLSFLYQPFAEGAFDLVLLFWSLALKRLIRGDGRYGLVMPTALLADERAWQHWITGNRPPDWITLLPVDFFISARIRTTAITGGRVRSQVQVSNRDPLSSSIADGARFEKWPSDYTSWNGVLSGVDQADGSQHLVDLASCTEINAACATSVAYEMVPLISDVRSGNGLRVHTTGAIDRFKSRWGKNRVRYLKNDFDHPRFTESCDLSRPVRVAVNRQRCSKIIVGGLTTVLEAWYDCEAEALGSKSTWILRAADAEEDPDANWWLLGIVNCASFSRLYASRYGARSMSGRQMTIQRKSISSIEIPDRSQVDSMIDTASMPSELRDVVEDSAVRCVVALAKFLQTEDEDSDWCHLDSCLHILTGLCYWLNFDRAIDDYRWWRDRLRLDHYPENLEPRGLRAMRTIMASVDDRG